MIKVSVLYPNRPGAKFDMKYYCEKHMPLVQQRLGAACKQVAVEQGISGMPGTPAAFAAMGHLYCESVEAFQDAFAPHAQEILADIANYTDIEPTIQISDVKM
jgi:uncharacterized protein (TIGR02118 family)